MNKTYKLKWESNSRTKYLADLGIINHEDVISKRTTNDFPEDCATVRLEQPRSEMPLITIHFKGSNQKSAQHAWAYQSVPTARISFGGDSSYWTKNNTCTVSGELDFDAWPLDAVDAVVNAVKLAFETELVPN